MYKCIGPKIPKEGPDYNLKRIPLQNDENLYAAALQVQIMVEVPGIFIYICVRAIFD